VQNTQAAQCHASASIGCFSISHNWLLWEQSLLPPRRTEACRAWLPERYSRPQQQEGHDGCTPSQATLTPL